jgi:hypothetical protein
MKLEKVEPRWIQLLKKIKKREEFLSQTIIDKIGNFCIGFYKFQSRF